MYIVYNLVITLTIIASDRYRTREGLRVYIIVIYKKYNKLYINKKETIYFSITKSKSIKYKPFDI